MTTKRPHGQSPSEPNVSPEPGVSVHKRSKLDGPDRGDEATKTLLLLKTPPTIQRSPSLDEGLEEKKKDLPSDISLDETNAAWSLLGFLRFIASKQVLSNYNINKDHKPIKFYDCTRDTSGSQCRSNRTAQEVLTSNQRHFKCFCSSADLDFPRRWRSFKCQSSYENKMPGLPTDAFGA